MQLSDASVRNLKLKAGAADRLVAGGNGLYLRLRQGGSDGIVTLAEFTPKLRPLRFMAL